MIIAFYPGGCGNRYLQYLLGNEWATHRRSYDNAAFQLFEHRYLLSSVPPAVQEHTLTHSVNSQQIGGAFPDQPIVFIKTDLQKSLRREWMLHGHQRFMTKKAKADRSRIEHYNAIKDTTWPEVDTPEMLDHLPPHILKEVTDNYVQTISSTGVISDMITEYSDKIESAYENIQWHLDYYKTYPKDFSKATAVIDVESSDIEFAQIVRNELELYSSEVFDNVWKKIHEQ
ncbi:hypothetical protein UFOVP328_213 [uncultured Caudovirales phage]|uniref:Uncharacterized protein n=1 Tax=uncultured Caudovirales phage TaxID=2100421 RepID=A0A6J5LZ38_9CAUD|nr:hypothetical protein UFOVP328_213 [uncultured Caudovirales phage]